MKCTNNVVIVKIKGQDLVYLVHCYNNNLTKCQTLKFTSVQRALEFIEMMDAENSVPMIYLETLETFKKRRHKLESKL